MKKLILLIFLSLSVLSIIAQNNYTLYDDLPGIEKMYKPTFDNSFTGWKRMLYNYPVNFFEIEQDFNRYINSKKKEKSPIIRYYKIWSRAVRPYVNSKGEIKLPGVQQIRLAQNKAQKSAYLKRKSINNASNWTFLGPKETFWLKEKYLEGTERVDAEGNPKQCPWQVNVYSFDVFKQDSAILYCGTETGYVNKTINGGQSWELLGKDYNFGGGIGAVAIHPTNPDIVYVSGGNQVHRTADGGITWQPLLPVENSFNAVRMKIHPDNPNIIVAASWAGLFITKNGGASWSKKWSKSVYDVDFKPDNPSVIYGISKDSYGNFQIIISNNEGSNFTVNAQFPKTYQEKSGGLLAVTPANPNLLYVAMLCTVNGKGVPFIVQGEFKDNLFVWTQTKEGTADAGLGGFGNGQGYFDFVLAVAPQDANTIFFGTCSLFKSTDGGYNFDKVGGYGGDFPIHPDIQDIKMLKNGAIWVSTDGGMNFSSDYFVDVKNYVSRTNNLIGSDMWGFDQGWNEDVIVGGRYHNGNTAIADFYGNKALRMGGAESATGWVLQGRSRHVAFNDLGQGWILPPTAEDYPTGRFVFSKYPNMDEYGGRRSNLVHHPNYYNTIYIGSENGIWKSEDMGASFDLLYQFAGRVRFLQISYKNPNVLYADVVDKGLYKSEDGGKTWMHKSALTNNYVNSYWAGKMFFVISPYDENRIYTCLSNGAWSSDRGKVYVSKDGGDSWSDFSGRLNLATKCLAIQPTAVGKDLVYLFTLAKSGEVSEVFYRYEDEKSWRAFNNNYPAGMGVNLALPFYRDGKLRVSGTGGVWESPLKEQEFAPIVNPWVAQANFDCSEDTLYFDDHSMLNHKGVAWKWQITPAPSYISDANARNPKVVLGTPGSYDVQLSVTQNGKTYTKEIKNMVTATSCPSVYDCDNPGRIAPENMQLIYVDSEETNYADRSASNAFDGNPATFWHTEWYQKTDNQPHELQIDLGREYLVSKFSYLPRQDGSFNGRVKEYELYISSSKNDYETAVKKSVFANESGEQEIALETPKVGRYVRFKSLSEQKGQAFTAIAELTFTGCVHTNTATSDYFKNEPKLVKAYPIPAKDVITIALPNFTKSSHWNYQIFAPSGQQLRSGSFETINNQHRFNVSDLNPGVYAILISNEAKQVFRVKIVVE